MFKSEADKIKATARKRGLKASTGKEGKTNYVQIEGKRYYSYMNGVQASYTAWINRMGRK